MHTNTKFEFRDDINEMLVDIEGKWFADIGMTWGELSKATGINMEILEKHNDWYVLSDGLYYFKKHYIFEELFMRELAYECSVNCVDFKLATDNTSNGIISKLYRDTDKKYYMYSDFCEKYLHFVPDNLMVFKLASSIALGEEKTQVLMNDISSLVTFDMFSGQWDRMEYNFFFECSENSIRIASLCDNGMIFSKSLIYHSPFGEISLSQVDDGKDSRKSILFWVLNDKMFAERLSILLNVNINEVLKRTISKYRIIMGSGEESRILNYFDNRKKVIEHTLKLSKGKR